MLAALGINTLTPVSVTQTLVDYSKEDVQRELQQWKQYEPDMLEGPTQREQTRHCPPGGLSPLVAALDMLDIPILECISMADELRSIHEIDSEITQFEHVLSVSSRYDPRCRPSVHCLAMLRLLRHNESNQREDLDKAILHFTESLLLAPRSWLEYGRVILEALFNLAFALFKRSEVCNQPEDVIYAAKYLRHLRHQPHPPFCVLRRRVTTTLVHALALQVELEAGNVTQDIEEMAVLCHELVMDASDNDTIGPITLFANVVTSKTRLFAPDPPSNQVIDCLRLVRKYKPDVSEARYALALSLSCRYCMTCVNDDYEEAASIFDEIIASSSPGDGQDELMVVIQGIVRGLAWIRTAMHENPEYSEEAIYRAHAYPCSSSDMADYMERAAEERFRYFGSIEGLEASPSNSPLSQPVPVLSIEEFKDVPKIDPTLKKHDLLDGLLSGIRDNDITEIDEAIEKGRSVVASVPRDLLTSIPFLLLGKILFAAFERTNKIEYLNESISTHRQVLERPSMHTIRSWTFGHLVRSLFTRLKYFPDYCTQDLDELVKLLSQCANDGDATLPNRILFACKLAFVARRTRHPSVSTAYESAMSLKRDTLLFAPTLQLQHATLATSHNTHSMPLDYASYQVDLHQLEEAVETLERGRALLWSEMRHLRISVDQLLEADPQLGHKFAAVNQDLEELTKSIPPSHGLNVDDGGGDDLRAVDPFGRLLLKQRRLLKERDNLISQIQALPGFDSFLTSPSFDTLRSAASSGPVIIINHSKWRSDILILLPDTSPSLIPTPRDFYDRARALKDKLLDSRLKSGLDSGEYDRTLASVLADLYKLVGKPVIDRLRQLQVPEQSRIWWCPTSVFCSLPLHAMGPIPSDDGEIRYFLDLYICSYTPTLSALIQSRNRDSGSRSSDQPSLLLVAQPDPSLPTVGGEIQVVQALDTEVTSLISEAATPAVVIDGFHHHRFIHFACHGTLEAGKPFEAGFELYGGERLTLLEIVRSRLPAAEFAFLSACHTAEVTEGSLDDEGLHLAAAVQYCGFRSVVGTMWAMVDEDGRDLAEHFYKALFSTLRRVQGVPYYERSAKALRVAVKKLRRKKRITLERWVNFVHYGA
ncbi:CHAT domain-containing protein [Lactarius psammicola]|nr:CHAT domain-containing protein [Lactarius psammicola]